MDVFVAGAKRLLRVPMDSRMVISCIGFVCAIVFHELFHILMHWGEVTHLAFFTNIYTIAEVGAPISPNYDVVGEEIAAYTITLLTLLVTMIIVSHIHDNRDERPFSQTLSSKSSELGLLSASELLELARRSNILNR